MKFLFSQSLISYFACVRVPVECVNYGLSRACKTEKMNPINQQNSADLSWEKECAPIISYRLYTKKDAVDSKKIALTYEEISPHRAKNSIFNKPAVSVKVIFHGFGGSASDLQISSLTSAYLDHGHLVIATDYEHFHFFPNLFRYKSKLGECTAALIRAIVEKNSVVKYKDFHIVGFSIGGQLTAQVANHLGKDNKVKRITGLDPTRWMFFPGLVKEKDTLSKTHADFVDVIHTDVVMMGSNYNGGHYDFYVNGGSKQPLTLCKSCNDHLMSVEFFIQTIAKKLKYSVHKLDCGIWKWRFGWCKENEDLVNIQFGEYATKPSEKEEGSYMVFTEDCDPKKACNLHPNDFKFEHINKFPPQQKEQQGQKKIN